MKTRTLVPYANGYIATDLQAVFVIPHIKTQVYHILPVIKPSK